MVILHCDMHLYLHIDYCASRISHFKTKFTVIVFIFPPKNYVAASHIIKKEDWIYKFKHHNTLPFTDSMLGFPS